MDTFETELRQILGESGVLAPRDFHQRAAGIWRQSESLSGIALARPRNTQETAACLALCYQREIPVVTQGGLTGLVRGADTLSSGLVLSLERMNTIEQIDPEQRAVTAQAGVTLQQLQDTVAQQGLMFPLDLGARGTATLGGNASTNAGGNRVLKYGMMRDMVLGVEAVLADGTIINGLNPLIKNNAGYDLKQLFLGSEGTLGVITRLTLRLREAAQSRQMSLVAVKAFDDVKRLLRHMDRGLGGQLSAFEVLWGDFYRLVTTSPAQNSPPLPHGHPFYVLLESHGTSHPMEHERFTATLEDALGDKIIDDAVIAQSERECTTFWSIRDDVAQVFNEGDALLFDVSLPITAMQSYVSAVKSGLAETACMQCWTFGHVGDGNLHFAVQVPRGQAEELRECVERCVYQPLRNIKGSVSAEHGIGLEKKPWLPISRSEEELALMMTLKQALDPKNLLNPGKVIDVTCAEMA
jgi:FAD/FMN-containing dehydrogenase